jgi:peptidoglycan hydrolase-like protein with peptidoglycan-binding domain
VSWTVAAALDVLLAQLNARAPGRSRASDGAIGDDAHASRASDHNPWVQVDGQNLVTARDFTHDPAGGLDCALLAEVLVASRDPRIKYLIWSGRILSGAAGPDPWVWRAYHGKNQHTHHLHLSVVADARCQDRRQWQLRWPTVSLRTVLRRGDRGVVVEILQHALGISADGVFGPATEAAVKRFQAAHRLTVDGIAGGATWRAIDGIAA